MSVIENRNIKFINKIIDGEVYKTASGDVDYIIFIRDVTVLDEFIIKVNSAINGNLNIIESDVSADIQIAFITPNNVELWDEEGENVIHTITHQDFKEILIAWRDFLLSPPLHGSKV